VDGLASPPQEDGPEIFPEGVEVFVPQDLALRVDDAVAIEKAEGRAEAAVVDELDDRIEVLQPVFERRPGKDEGEG